MDDDVSQGWVIDPQTRQALRITAVRRLVQTGAWEDAILEAEELLDEAPEHAEGLSLLADALQAVGDAEGALQAWDQHFARVKQPSVHALVGAATARLDLCDLDGAAVLAREATRRDPASSEAHFILGVALERQEDRTAESASALVAAHQLDPVSFPFPVQLTAAQWKELITLALVKVHPAAQDVWDGVPVRLYEVPELATLRASDPPVSPRVAGLFVGKPPGEDESGNGDHGDDASEPSAGRPEALHLFTRNLTRASTHDEIAERIADVLEQEALAWLGVPDFDLDGLTKPWAAGSDDPEA